MEFDEPSEQNIEKHEAKMSVEELIKALRNEEWDAREEAAEALDKLGWVPKDDNERAYYLIAKKEWDALIKLGKPAVEPLIYTLKYKDEIIRGIAVRILGEIGDKRAVGYLIQALEDEDWEVRLRAAESLGKTGDERAIEPLTQALKDEDEEVRCDVPEALGEIGKPAVESLIQALEHEDEDVRMGAADALGKIGDKRAVEDLIYALLIDEDEIVREKAAEALGKIGDKRAVEPLLQALESEYPNVRYGAAIALGGIADESAVEPLIQALKDWNSTLQSTLRMGVIEALGKIRDKGAVEPLVHALKDENMYGREEAAKALEKMGWMPRNDDERAYYLFAKRKWDEFVKLGKIAIEPLIPRLIRVFEYDARDLDKAAKVLGKIGEPAIKFLIKDVLGSESYEYAVNVLVKIGESAVEPLIHALKSKCGNAALALGKIGDKRAVEPLIRALNDEKRYVRECAAEALGELRDERAIKPLTRVLNDEDEQVREAAKNALEKIIKEYEK